mmetsp:Transcript_17493/g.20696  ORF Transcript_17493/g.20696 Transcript_17493/m.20696 type:complete len:156 (-) Transcript_17493:260-727(-)
MDAFVSTVGDLWVGLTTCISFSLMYFVVTISAAPILKANPRRVICVRIFAIVCIIPALLMCISELVVTKRMQDDRFSGLNQNAFLEEISQFKGCSSLGLEEAIKISTTPLIEEDEHHAGKIACQVFCWLQLITMIVHFWVNQKTMQTQYIGMHPA